MAISHRLDGLWTPVSVDSLDIPDAPDKEFYKLFSLKFAKSYFYKNLLKCIIALEALHHHIDGDEVFVDLGAGSGAFSVALMASQNVHSLELIDYSDTQLDLAAQVLDRLGFNGERVLTLKNIAHFHAARKNCVASYAIGELIQNGIDIGEVIESSESFILVDHSWVVADIAKHLRSRGHHVFGRSVKFTVNDELRTSVEGGGGRFAFLVKCQTKQGGCDC